MSITVLPPAAIPAAIPNAIRLQLASPSAEFPDGDAWLHKIKHDGHRLIAIVGPDTLRLLSRNGRDRTVLFREPFLPLAQAGLPAMVLDGEIAVPDDRGATHIDGLSEAISERRYDRLGLFRLRPVALGRTRPAPSANRGQKHCCAT